MNILTVPAEKAASKPATKLATATQSPLAASLESAKVSVAKMADEVRLQQDRFVQIEKLKGQREETLLGVEQGNMTFDEGRKTLAEIAESIELHEFNTTRRAAGLGEEYAAVRAQIVALKFASTGRIKRVSMCRINERQSEARAFLADFGGRVESTTWPLVVADLIAADPTLANLETYRAQIDGWSAAMPAADLLRAVAHAENLITAKNLPEARPTGADALEDKLSDPVAILGFWPNRSGFDVIKVCASTVEADEFLSAADVSSTFAGARRLAKVGGAQTKTHRFSNSRNAIVGASADDRQFVKSQGYADHGDRWLADAANFLKG